MQQLFAQIGYDSHADVDELCGAILRAWKNIRLQAWKPERFNVELCVTPRAGDTTQFKQMTLRVPCVKLGT